MRLDALTFSSLAEEVALGFNTGKHYKPSWRKAFLCNLKRKTDAFNAVRFCKISFAFGNYEKNPELWFYGFLYRRLYKDNLNLTNIERKKIALDWSSVLLDVAKAVK